MKAVVPGSWPWERPQRPDPVLLAEARRSLGPAVGEWQVLRREDRRRATVFELGASTKAGELLRCFYKEYHVGEGPEAPEGQWVRTTRDGLARSRRLAERLAALGREEGIDLALVLAVDPERLRIVTLGVDGTPIGRAFHGLRGVGHRLEARAAHRRVGRALRLLEEASVGEPGLEETALWRSVALGSQGNGALSASLEARVRELEEGLLAERHRLFYAHGDVNRSNVLVAADRVGLIDIGWLPRFRGFDVAAFTFRVEYDQPVRSPLATELVEAVLDGYGDPETQSSPGWQAVRLRLLVRLLAGERWRVSGLDPRRRRALAELRGLV